MLSREERKELLEDAGSVKLRDEFRQLSQNRHDPFAVNGEVSLDRLLTFLTQYNQFINHRPKPFRRIVDKDIRF